MVRNVFIASSFAVAAFALASMASTPAEAAGCGGVVNMAKWGCAPWDNNDKFGKPIKKPVAQPKPVAVQRPVAVQKPAVVQKPQAPVVMAPASKLIGQDGAGFKPGGKGVVAGGAGN